MVFLMRRNFRQSGHPLQVELCFIPVGDQDIFSVGVFVIGAVPAALLEFSVRVVGMAAFLADSGGAADGAEGIVGGLVVDFVL